jgi:phosphatidylinositol glycan class M
MLKFLFVDLRYLNAMLIRLAMIVISEILFYQFNFVYTDIDYYVITDGAKHMIQFESPYNRETYRYTPLLALLMVPNHIINHNIGKILFSFIDVLCGLAIELLLNIQNRKGKEIEEINLKNFYETYINNPFNYISLIYLYNPLTINLCTRGSSDCIITFFVIVTLILIEIDLFYIAAFTFGFAIHFKIYPIIYTPALYLYIATRGKKKVVEDNEGVANVNYMTILSDLCGKLYRFIKIVINWKSILFVIITVLVFCSFFIFFYIIYGFQFVNEYLLYHISRKDHRHNYSMMYYLIYLTYTSGIEKILSFAMFIPQALLILISSLTLFKDINLCLLVNTMIFVTFNKVVTAQYFLWYISIIPLIVPRNDLFGNKKVKGLLLFIIWLFFELIWNYYSHKLEYKGENRFLEMWGIDVAFFLVNCYLIKSFINSHLKI